MKTLNLTFGFRQVLEVQNFSDEVQILIDLVGLIDKHYRKQRLPVYYALSLSLKVITLNSLSKMVLHKTVYELIQERLHHEAVHLLLTTDWSVKRIAYEIGYTDPCYFNRWFKKKTGFSPKQFSKAGLN
jgi:AraC-like DNA-binding protein